jgi:hypothetical protein
VVFIGREVVVVVVIVVWAGVTPFDGCQEILSMGFLGETILRAEAGVFSYVNEVLPQLHS